MNHERAKSIVDEVFQSILTAKSNQDIDSLVSGELAKNTMDTGNYPYIHLAIKPTEIQKLINSWYS